MTTTNVIEGYPYIGMFVKSPLDDKVYCRKNGDFLRHLISHNIATYKDLIQQLHPEFVKYCSCGVMCSFKQSTMTFLSCCGSPACAINARREGLRDRSVEQKQAHLLAIKKALKNIPPEVKHLQQLQRIATATSNDSYKKSVQKRETTCKALYGDVKYNNSKKISQTKLNWSNEQRQKFLLNLKAGLGGKNLHEFSTDETWIKRRKRLEAMGKLIPLELLDPWKRYKKMVRMLTEKVYKQNKDVINPTNLPRKTGGDGFHLDHKIPIAYGFVSGIPPEQIAALENLQMLPWLDNISKGKKYDPNVN